MAYTAGLIGLSGIGTRHYDAFKHTDGIELVAIADIDTGLLEARADEWGIAEVHRYEKHRELLASEDLDVVSIATPSFLHHRHVLDTVESNADPDVIWSEKPIAVNVTEAHEMVDVCEDAGVELVIDHMRRFHKPYRKLQRLINDDGLIGKVQSVHIQNPEELLRNGTHSIDLLTMLLDERAQLVFGHLKEQSGSGMSLDEWDDRAGGGIIVTESGTYVNADFTTARSVASGGWLIVGDRGKIEFNEGRNELDYWTLVDSDDGSYGTEHVETDLPDLNGDLNDYEAMFRGGGSHIVDLLNDDEPNRSPGRTATHVLEIIVGLFISNYTGSAIDLPLDRPLEDVTVQSR
ncbi:Gfo/Idh/MocA family protein [Saliphagus sp. LR7]|uniref:Gfo/Idh/MocA family protein n=1 Tax=Saliphagus sp. LR7 TaxID=2282654 RepID=UPI00130018B5|nr:Gfo/Idh/MocA family oxidoreductase [Saliphagus sp. LR7]